MNAERMLEELEVAGAEDTSTVDRDRLRQEVEQEAALHQLSQEHWRSVALLERALAALGPDSGLARALALVLGSRVELIMGWADALGVVPPDDMVARSEQSLRRAVESDPTVADVHWDLAVVLARYRGDYASAGESLRAALDLGYAHPMVPRLQALLAAQPPPPPAASEPGTLLRQLLLRLADQATSPDSRLLRARERGNEQGAGPPATFGDYLAAAEALASAGDLTQFELLDLLDAAGVFQGSAAERVVALLREMAEGHEPGPFLDEATDRHLRLLRSTAFAHFGRRGEGVEWVRSARGAAEAGLAIVDASPASVDPDLHAELLLAKGQALYAAGGELEAGEAIRCYADALSLKRRAEKVDDAARLEKMLWEQITHRVGKGVMATMVGGIGEGLEVLRICVEVVGELGDPVRAADVRLRVAILLRQSALREQAETMLRSLLSQELPDRLRYEVEVELASIYSETGHAAEAAALQRSLLDRPIDADDPRNAVIWANYANSLRLLEDHEGAREALRTAWKLLPPEETERTGDRVPSRGIWIRTLMAQLEMLAGRAEDAWEHLEMVEALGAGPPIGLEGMHIARVKAQVLMALGRFDEASRCLDTAIANFNFLLRQGPSLPTWESLLAEWTTLDGLSIRAALRGTAEERFEQALLRAEGAKGRISAWLERVTSPGGSQWALSPERQREALAAAREWLAARPGRRIVSLFATSDGLGIFALASPGGVAGTWMDDFDYDVLSRDLFLPWQRLVDGAFDTGDRETLAVAAALTDHLLDRVGAWLWRAVPSLAEGGSDLLIIPHRLFAAFRSPTHASPRARGSATDSRASPSSPRSPASRVTDGTSWQTPRR
jgi:tetratricopeptide (TPR) repeat protein